MKKKILTTLAVAAMAFTLTSCGSVSQNYADKINAASATSKTDDDFTYEKVVKDLGKNWVANATGAGSIFGTEVKATGVVTWAKGCKNADDLKSKQDAGKKVEMISVTFLNGVATSATYTVWTPSSSSK